MNPESALLLAVAAAVVSTWIAVPRSPRRSVHRLAPAVVLAPAGRGLLRWTVLPLGVPPVLGSIVAGSRGLVVVLAAEAVVATAVWLARRWWRRRRAIRTADEIAHGCQVLASQLAVGRVPTEALDAAAEDCPVLARGRAVLRLGGDVVATWRDQARAPGHAGLLDLARAWQVSESTGAPMAEMLGRVASALARQRRLAGVLGAELAAPRATAQLLAVLPVVGVALGFGLGGDPASFLLEHPLGQACLLAGVGLACGGVVWVERISAGRHAVGRHAREPEGGSRPRRLRTGAG